MILEKALGFVFYLFLNRIKYILGLAVKFTCFLAKIIKCTNVGRHVHLGSVPSGEKDPGNMAVVWKDGF